MEGIGSEVSQKIRAAIKAKLIELGAYVDDELPDYIMVMVANKRTRSQMDEDLQLFLTSNTKIFTSWLHTVLQKLQEVTVANFDNKKESESKKLKRKKSELDDGTSRKSSEEGLEKVKKHSKKHKEVKKGKKNKHKSKEKTKSKSEKKHERDESKDKSAKEGDKNEKKTSQNSEKKEKMSKNKRIQLDEAVGKAILGNLKKNKRLKSDKNESPSESSSSGDESSNVEEKSLKETEKSTEHYKKGTSLPDDNALKIKADEPEAMDVDCNKKNAELVEDEFNIEPLKPSERSNKIDLIKDAEPEESVKVAETTVQAEKTISAPTEELLKEHDKIESQKLEGEKKATQTDSDESVSPEEMRKQLLLSRAKKKLEESKLAERMRSNSPDVLILEESSQLGGTQKDLQLTSNKQPEGRSSQSPQSKESSGLANLHSGRIPLSSSSARRSPLEVAPLPVKETPEDQKSSFRVSPKNEFRRRMRMDSRETFQASSERKKNVIRISESLEMEKNMGLRKESDQKSKEKESVSRRSVSSRVVTITGPEAPEIPSIVKVKPREFISKEKQANKALILKAVADAEKSIATVHPRNEIDAEPKKKEALFTKNLRGKRYEKLAVTLSNIRKSPDGRDRLERRVSVDSDKSDRTHPKLEGSEGSGVRIKSDLLCEDQFISSKTTLMEKNEKYIRCWLEGVEKAVKDDEIVNPSEMEDFGSYKFTEEESELLEKKWLRKKRRRTLEASKETASKMQKLSHKEMSDLRLIPNSGAKEEGPQIVVTLDGLNSKTIKDLILRNKETGHKPILSSAKNEEREKVTQRISLKKNSPPEVRKSGPERMSDRFGRLNKANEESDPGKREEKKGAKYQSSEKEKKEKTSTESKNRQLIAQLSEKFGKVDREFENKKRQHPEETRRHSYETRKNQKEDGERNGRYRRSERRSFREGSDSEDRSMKSRERCLF